MLAERIQRVNGLAACLQLLSSARGIVGDHQPAILPTRLADNIGIRIAHRRNAAGMVLGDELGELSITPPWHSQDVVHLQALLMTQCLEPIDVVDAQQAPVGNDHYLPIESASPDES